MRSIVNWCRGLDSGATSILVPTVLFVPAAWGVGLAAALVPHAHPEAFDHAIDVTHARADPEEEESQQSPGPGTEPAIRRPSEGETHEDRDHQLEADAEAEAHRLLGRRTRICVARAPLARL